MFTFCFHVKHRPESRVAISICNVRFIFVRPFEAKRRTLFTRQGCRHNPQDAIVARLVSPGMALFRPVPSRRGADLIHLSHAYDLAGLPAALRSQRVRTMCIDLAGDRESLWRNLKKGCRYDIKRAETDGVVCDVTGAPSQADLGGFVADAEDLFKRKGMRVLPLNLSHASASRGELLFMAVAPPRGRTLTAHIRSASAATGRCSSADFPAARARPRRPATRADAPIAERLERKRPCNTWAARASTSAQIRQPPVGEPVAQGVQTGIRRARSSGRPRAADAAKKTTRPGACFGNQREADGAERRREGLRRPPRTPRPAAWTSNGWFAASMT